MSFLDAVRAVHVAAGSVALLSFLVPAVAKKGGLLHRRAGWTYVAAMAAVAASGVVVCGWRLLYDTDPGRRIGAWFLLYVSVLTAASSSHGVRVLRTKARSAAHHHPWDLGLPALLVLMALATAGYGLAVGQPLLVGFAPVGLIVGGGQLAYWLRPPAEKMHWWFAHMGSMLGACIGTVTAFLVVNAPRLGLSSRSLLVWLAPSVAGVAANAAWTAYYRRRFAGARRPAGSAGSAAVSAA